MESIIFLSLCLVISAPHWCPQIEISTLHVCSLTLPCFFPSHRAHPDPSLLQFSVRRRSLWVVFWAETNKGVRSTTRLLLSTLITVLWQHNTANLRSLRYCTNTHESGSVSLCLLISSTNVFLIGNSGLELHKTKKGKYNPHSLPLPPALSRLLPLLSLSLSLSPSLSPSLIHKKCFSFSVL